MAFNQLKKWVGTQLWSTFMTEYNENVDELNRVIDGVNENAAEIQGRYVHKDYSLSGSSSMTVETGPGRDIYLVLTTQGGAITGLRTAWIVFCANVADYNGSVIKIAEGASSAITVTQSATSTMGAIEIENNHAGAAFITVIKLAP